MKIAGEIKVNINRAILSLLLLFIACVACSPADYAFRGVDPENETKDGKPIYRLGVNNPSLSPDGRYMAFDFHEFFYKGRQSFATLVKIGLYDLERQTIEILTPPHPMQQWHSPSFDRKGERLTFVSTCFDKTCPDELIRTHIFVLDLQTKKFEQLTDNRQQVSGFAFNFGTGEALNPSNPHLSKQVVRGFPVFSADGKRIYYVASVGHQQTSVFWMQFLTASYWIRYLDFEDPPKPFRVRDENLLNELHDVVIFNQDGRIIVLDNDMLIFSVHNSQGRNYKKIDKQKVCALAYDIQKDKFFSVFDKNNVPFNPKYPKAEQYGFQSLTGSFDGKRIGMIRGEGNLVSVWENGRFRDIATAEQFGLRYFLKISISGNGKRLAILPSYKFPVNDIDDFWLVDLDSGKMKSLPLRSLLRKTIESGKSDTKV